MVNSQFRNSKVWDGETERRAGDRRSDAPDIAEIKATLDELIEMLKTAFPDGDLKGHHDFHVGLIEDAKAWRERKKNMIDKFLVGLAGAAVPTAIWLIQAAMGVK